MILKRKSAFTLVELLVVIAIIAVLISILLPSLSAAKEQSKSVRCLANLKQIGLALHMYASQNNDSLPIGDSNGKAHNTRWSRLLMNLLDSSVSPTWSSAHTPMFQCPSALLMNNNRCHYSGHPRLLPWVDPKPGQSEDPYYGEPPIGRWMTTSKLATVGRPSDLAIVWDGNQYTVVDAGDTEPEAGKIDGDRVNSGKVSLYIKPGEDISKGVNPGPNKDVPDDKTSGCAQYRWRHNNNQVGCFLFTDGHGAALRKGEAPSGTSRGTSELRMVNILQDRP